MYIKLVGLALLITSTGHAASFSSSNANNLGIKAEPLYGYETIYRLTPTPHSSTRSYYGLRLSAGKDILSGEVEYTKAADTENYATAPEMVQNSDEKLKLGVRSTYNFNKLFFVTGRLGGQATKNTNEETNVGIRTKVEKPITYSPYAGAHLGIRLGSVISVSAGTTVVFSDNKDLSRSEVQSSISFSIGK